MALCPFHFQHSSQRIPIDRYINAPGCVPIHLTYRFVVKGGKFNFTTTMDFPQTGHRVLIEQRFHGVDVFNYLRMSINVAGDIPSISHGAKIEIPDYEEEHRKTGLGIILSNSLGLASQSENLIYISGEFRSSSRRVFRVEGSGLDIPVSVEHVINYEECPFASLDNTTVLKLKVGRNFVTYDARELIVRFAMTNKISPLQGSTVVFLLATCKRQLFLLCPTETEDPCVKGQASCVPNSVCIVEKDTFRCVCSKG